MIPQYLKTDPFDLYIQIMRRAGGAGCILLLAALAGVVGWLV